MFGRNCTGCGQRGGMGFGFRGSSTPWSYIGRGRGGLPRCSYYLGNRVNTAFADSSATKGQEIDFLMNQAADLKKGLETIESRLRDIEASKK
jgi:Family of unknown function (DUF5320)